MWIRFISTSQPENMSIGHEAKTERLFLSLTELRTAGHADTILLFHQEANPKKGRAEKKQQSEDDPAVRRDSLAHLRRVG
jgi:hypothetical protein